MTGVMALQFHIIEYKPTEPVFVRSQRINIRHTVEKKDFDDITQA